MVAQNTYVVAFTTVDQVTVKNQPHWLCVVTLENKGDRQIDTNVPQIAFGEIRSSAESRVLDSKSFSEFTCSFK